MIAARNSRETGRLIDSLIDHVGRLHQNGIRNLETERLGGLAVDDHFELRGLLDRQVGGSRAF
jgi:hypothetical protein